MLENYRSKSPAPARAQVPARPPDRAGAPSRSLAAAALIAALHGCGGAPTQRGLPDGKLPLIGAVAHAGTGSAAGDASAALDYHGGNVMRGTAGVYLIWYGGWAAEPARSIVPNLLHDLGGSRYLALLGAYSDGAGARAATDVELRGETVDAYSAGRTLADGDVALLVLRAITSRALPLDESGVYLVLASADVRESSGSCTSYCGFHQSGEIIGQRVRWAYVGNPAACMSACAPAGSDGPNGDAVGDAIASIVAHEIAESITDPDLDAWYDRAGAESGDKCAWSFGETFAAANGARANLRLGSRSYLLQQIWSNGAAGCALAPP